MPSVVSSVGSLFQNLINSIFNVFTAIFGVFQNGLQLIFGLIQTLIQTVFSLLNGVFDAAGHLIQSAAKLVGGTIGVMWANLFAIAIVGGGYYLYTQNQNNSRRGIKSKST